MGRSGFEFVKQKRQIIRELLTLEKITDEEEAEQASIDWNTFDIRYLRAVLDYDRRHTEEVEC